MRKISEMPFRLPLDLIIIVIISLVLRLVWLDKVPTGISNDELGFIINAKAVFLTGKDVSGLWSPFSLTPVTGSFPQAEIPYLILSPFIGILPFSLFAAKLPFVLINTFLVVVLYLITSKLIGKRVAFFVGIAGSLNPWFIFFSRTAYEAPLAIFFYILAFYFLLSFKKWKILLAFVPFFIGFYCYMGTKLLLIPYALLIILYTYNLNQKKYLKQYGLLLAMCISLFVYFIFSLQHQSTKSRLSELSMPSNTVYSATVNNERKLSVKTPLTLAFSNKFVVFGKDLINKYFRVFSTNLLFLNGEGRSTFSLWYHGYFYYLDFIFLIVGYCVLYARKKNLWLLTSGLLFIAPLPAVASNIETGFAALRASLLFPVFIILIGSGIEYTIYLRKRKFYIIATGLFVTVLYVIQVLHFINIYLFRNPIYNSEAFNLSSRILSKYVQFAGKGGRNIFVVSNNPMARFYEYLFYENLYNPGTKEKIRELVLQNNFQFNNVHYVQCSDKLDYSDKDIMIVDVTTGCTYIDLNKYKDNITIPQLSDGGAIYKIINDRTCSQFALSRYPYDFLFSDFAIENLPEKRFCEKFTSVLQ